MCTELMATVESRNQLTKEPALHLRALNGSGVLHNGLGTHCDTLLESDNNFGFRLTLEHSVDSSTICALRGPTHLIKFPPEAVPSISEEDLTDKVVKAGSAIRFDVRFNSGSLSEVIWSVSCAVLRNDSRTTIQPSDSLTKKAVMTIYPAQRADTGKYKLTIRHVDTFIDEVTNVTSGVEVYVTSVPARPQGLLTVSHMSSTTARLKFKKPLDDGGQDISHYEFEKQEAGTGNWVPCGRTKDANETEGKVEGLTPGKKHLFRVRAVNGEGVGEPLESSTVCFC
ncbi:hypothetical protein RvY_00240 [Ramazzottius varieornatus]|uniref:Fibronectin type-III domain-containing protein n=1 Tax=Ramazzottius varieornatus TaxID=947166 RepID=A0A1D1UCI3_RAMVA|nr:hypothetical protein RvY_00240 [Ramazzottius varieornatus]